MEMHVINIEEKLKMIKELHKYKLIAEIAELNNHTTELQPHLIKAALNKLNKSMTYSNISFIINLWIFKQHFSVF